MQELINLQQQCLNLILKHQQCGDKCLNDHFCKKNGCNESDCSKCMNHIQRATPPSFHYSCNRITYYYILRFFNRFASEISYFTNLLANSNYFKKLTDLYIVSLGCGPGSEIFGFLKSFSKSNLKLKIHYEGHDLEKVWETVQEMSKIQLTPLGHDINFYSTNLFEDYHGFQNDSIHILVLNYLLSDAIKYMTYEQRKLFIEDIISFVIEHNVKSILFNDINYYGCYQLLNSGVQLMKLMIKRLKEKGKNIKEYYFYFPYDPYRGHENWKEYPSNKLILKRLENNPYMNHVTYCNSKQIFIIIQ